MLLQRQELVSNIELSENNERATELEDQSLEDEFDSDIEHDKASNTFGNASKQTCRDCKKSMAGRRGAKVRRAIILKCAKDHRAANNGKRPMRADLIVCLKKTMVEKCKDDCAYGSPCDQCKRNLVGKGVDAVAKKCKSEYHASMRKLCAVDCSEKKGFHLLEHEGSSDVMADANYEQVMTGPPGCHNCVRRDHNFGRLRVCRNKVGNSTTAETHKKWLTCVGDAIWAKCKDKCVYSDPCLQCKSKVIIGRRDRLVKTDFRQCLDAGQESLCSDTCNHGDEADM